MAKTYSIETLLEGKLYRSNSRGLEGLIQNAEKRSEVYYDNAEAYLVRVRHTNNGKGFPKPDFYATIAVKVGE